MKRGGVHFIKSVSAYYPRYAPLIWHVKRATSRVSITFDDGPTPLTLKVLACLADYNVKATFFVLGTQIEKHPEILDRLISARHEVGIHGYDHSMNGFLEQVKRCKDSLVTHCVIPRIVRTPRCVIHPILTLRLWCHGYKSVIYSFDTHDSMRLEGKWSGPPPEYSQVKGGDIILMHDDNAQCIADLPCLLQSIRQNNLHPVTVSELINGS